ncbi:TPA: GNAT family N-acetyltransferase [Vibrio harveyi]|uniref:GNAT family N-acetyltransferase n=1 Tax=Vibrio harveyi TaxID=669 RepID=UPI0039094A6D
MISLFEMEVGCFDRFRENFIREYAGSISSNYGYSEETSFEFASLDFDMRLPNKLDTDGNSICSIKLGELSIGHLWYVESAEDSTAFICDLFVEEKHRNLGYGELVLELLESRLKQSGITRMKLHVANGNNGALRLYTRLGYLVTGHNLFKKFN